MKLSTHTAISLFLIPCLVRNVIEQMPVWMCPSLNAIPANQKKNRRCWVRVWPKEGFLHSWPSLPVDVRRSKTSLSIDDALTVTWHSTEFINPTSQVVKTVHTKHVGAVWISGDGVQFWWVDIVTNANGEDIHTNIPELRCGPCNRSSVRISIRE